MGIPKMQLTLNKSGRMDGCILLHTEEVEAEEKTPINTNICLVSLPCRVGSYVLS